jgi:HPt (histidine-containing phosphotransfer) domain-containing protein
MATNTIDSERFNRLLDDVGIEFIQELFSIFKADYEPLIMDLDQAVQKRDFEKIRFISHRMKSGGANLGANLFAGLCHDLEKIDANVENETLIAKFNELKRYFYLAVTDLNTQITAINSPRDLNP